MCAAKGQEDALSLSENALRERDALRKQLEAKEKQITDLQTLMDERQSHCLHRLITNHRLTRLCVWRVRYVCRDEKGASFGV
jgi:hypothetical protein